MNAMPPPLSNEDRLPHEKAVWRDYAGDGMPAGVQRYHQVSVDYDGMLFESLAGMIDWPRVTRWRFGWAPA